MALDDYGASPLYSLFKGLVGATFTRKMGITDEELTRYLAGVLTDFAHFDRVYGVRDIAGRPVEEVADMLMQADILLGATSFTREREVHKHIGDFTLFWTGVYPESLPRLRSATRKDHLVNYVRQGKESYFIASTFNYGEYAAEARVLRRLSLWFEAVAEGLHEVRAAWESAPKT